MDPNSRETIHIGVNFVVNPPPVVDPQSYIAFQQSLVERGLQFQRSESDPSIVLIREKPTSLEVKSGPISGSPVGQLLIVAPHPRRDLALFTLDADCVVEAFEATWPVEKRQIISSDATLHDLYETSRDHAFEELWETLLRQSPETLAGLGRPVLGGGLRFVMPPQPTDPEPVQIELKIESFLRQTRKIYVETQFTWPQPMSPGESLDPGTRLEQVNDYIEETIIPFIAGGFE